MTIQIQILTNSVVESTKVRFAGRSDDGTLASRVCKRTLKIMYTSLCLYSPYLIFSMTLALEFYGNCLTCSRYLLNNQFQKNIFLILTLSDFQTGCQKFNPGDLWPRNSTNETKLLFFNTGPSEVPYLAPLIAIF